MGSFLSGLVSIIAKEVASAVVGEVSSRLDKMFDRSAAFEKFDQEKKELVMEARNAKTPQEIEAVLDKIYEARPKFG